jgi:hypothetical protein
MKAPACQTLRAAARRVTIPMPGGFDSLNAAAAAACVCSNACVSGTRQIILLMPAPNRSSANRYRRTPEVGVLAAAAPKALSGLPRLAPWP